MPRRIAVARQAGGFDAIGWTLLGFLLGASLAVFALLHADFGSFSRPLATAAAPAPPAAPIVRYTPPPPTAPALVGTPQASPGPSPVHAVVGGASSGSSSSALASAGAASAHAAREPASPAVAKGPSTRSAPPATDAETADDAAAAGMTSRAGAAPSQAQDLF